MKCNNVISVVQVPFVIEELNEHRLTIPGTAETYLYLYKYAAVRCEIEKTHSVHCCHPPTD